MRRQGVADNPVLVGAGSILVILVMVLLSYNASTGLPFVPTYNITADVPSGANLVKGNDVRIGGARVGQVISITPMQKDGDYYAQLALKLEKNVGPIPANSRIEVRPRSMIGLKYIELTLGDSQQTIPNGGSLPLKQATVATEFEDLLDTFDKRVREGNKKSLQEFGNAFAGRGADLNAAFGEIAPLFQNLEPVARTISDPGTRLADFIRALARAATDTAATGDQAGEVFANADRTFAAFAAAGQGIQRSLTELPPTLAVGTQTMPEVRSYFGQLNTLMIKFQPGAKYMPEVADNLANITVNGPNAFRHLSRTSPKFTTTFNNLGAFAADPQVLLGFKGLATFVQVLNQPLSYVTPAQSYCNYAGIFARNVASIVSSRDSYISWLRVGLIGGFQNPYVGANSEAGAASAPAAFTANLNGDTSNYLHSNPYPVTGQNKVCGAGNEISQGKNSTFGTKTRPAPLGKQVAIGQPGDTVSGQTTENTDAIGSQQVRK